MNKSTQSETIFRLFSWSLSALNLHVFFLGMQIVNKFVATMDEMVELLGTDLTQANTEAIIDSVGTVCKVARQQMSTEAKVRFSLCHQLEAIDSVFHKHSRLEILLLLPNFIPIYLVFFICAM